MENFVNHFYDWLVLLALLGAAIYTMRVIRHESSSIKDESVEVVFKGLTLSVPRWWTQTRFEENAIQFERTDTRYDWYGRFNWIEGFAELPMTELLEKKLLQDELYYDKDDVVIETDGRVLFRDSNVQDYFREVIRVEGKSFQTIENRVYMDLCLMRGQDKKGYFLFESRSSVLNGMVEGPFFEELLAEISLVDKA